MDEIELDEKFSDILRTLESKASDPPPPYWVYGEEEYEDWCYDCLRAAHPNAEIGDDYGGGYCCSEEDGSEVCHKCGKLLGYVLTDYGVEQELCHFEEYPPDLNDADECYQLARIGHGIYKNDDQVRRLIALVEQAQAEYERREEADYRYEERP